MATTIACCRQRRRQLAACSDSAQLDIDLLLCHVLACDASYLRTWPERTLDEQQASAFEQLFARRLGGEPVAYLIGERGFWNLVLAVNSHTLIPRPETELLVEVALELSLPAQTQALDLGTGSGAIALALASERPHWRVDGIDIDAASVDLASHNARRNDLPAVGFHQSDWFSEVTGSFDLLVSNPPYINAEDPHLEHGDVRYEPRRALVADRAGFADIETLADQGRQYLNAGGWLVFEHGFEQGAASRALLQSLGYQCVSTHQDLAGHDRVTAGQWT